MKPSCLSSVRLFAAPISRQGISLSVLIAAAMATACGGGSDGSPAETASPQSVATSITTQPADQTVTAGSPARFTVLTAGTGLSYQWQVSLNGGITWTDVPGAVAAILTVQVTPFELNGSRYRVVVKGAGGTVISSAATLNLGNAVVAPSISVNVAATSVVAGADAVFTVTASGTSLTYQWQFSLDNINWSTIAGATNSTLRLIGVLTSDNGKRYRVLITNSAGSVTSAPVLLSVSAPPSIPVITSAPAPVSVTAPGPVTFSVAATGVPAPGYQWQRSADGVNYVPIAGATGNTYTLASTSLADNGARFRVVVANSAGTTVSAAAQLTVNPTPPSAAAPRLTTTPVAATVPVGSMATFSALATGTPAPNYQWRISTDGGVTFANITGATSPSYTTPATSAADDGKRFAVVVTNATGSVTSDAVRLTVASFQLRLGGSAFYQPQLNATVLVNANLPRTLSLGVAGIRTDGTMTWATARAWITALNASRYLGYSDWRLPNVNPLNGTTFQLNNLPSDPSGYAGGIDLGYNVSAPGTRYAGSTASELPFLSYSLLGNLAKFSPGGQLQNQVNNRSVPFVNLAQGNYWTSRSYSVDGAWAFDMANGTQYAFTTDWSFSVMVVRSGDSAP